MKNTSYTMKNEIYEQLKATNGDLASYTNQMIHEAVSALGQPRKIGDRLMRELTKVSRGQYIFSNSSTKVLEAQKSPTDPSSPTSVVPKAPVINMSVGVSSTVNDSVYVPEKDPTFVGWGNFGIVKNALSSKQFFPIYISGLSGNGKTVMVEQACAQLKREYVRVQISPETDEDDLLGGFRLINGETVFQKGPVLKAMEHGAVLLIDELDRGTNKIMCLQGVLEGKPVMVKKTGEVITPAPGFTVVATANTKGRGSDDGRYTGANIIDDAFIERFVATIEQPYATPSVEKKILDRHIEKHDCQNESFVTKLVAWGSIIRKTFEDGGVDDFVSTRRLCHIIHTFSIFNDEKRAIELCTNRFDSEVKIAFMDLYEKIGDGSQILAEDADTTTTDTL